MARKKKILVVDDDPDFLFMIKAILETKGYQAITVTNGREALKKVKSVRPDVVLLDVLMPKFDGLQTLKKIRTYRKDLPVFIITGFSDREKFKLARKLNASGFLVKTSDLEGEIENISGALRIAGRYTKS